MLSLLCPAEPAAKPALPKGQTIQFLGTQEDVWKPAAPGVLAPAAWDTTYFGGTTWNSDSSRWEAIQDSVWTFDTGVGSHFDHSDPSVDPFKSPGRHAAMEGWYGFDYLQSGNEPYFRRVHSGDSRWNAVCVGSAAGLGGVYSMWAGAFEEEADALCWAAGQGYGNNWNLGIRKLIDNVGGVNGRITFDYVIETEGCCDYVELYVDPTGSPIPDSKQIVPQAQGGHLSGSSSVTGHQADLLISNNNWPSLSGSSAYVYFVVESDGGWSDEDFAGGFQTECGAIAIDNVVITESAALIASTDFEADQGGWALAPPTPGPGDFSDLQTVSSLGGFQGVPCDCALSDSVLTFNDGSGKAPDQQNLAGSPWIDLKRAGLTGSPGKFIEFDYYADMPLLNGVYMFFQIQWYPFVCPATGTVTNSGWQEPSSFWLPFGPELNCTTNNKETFDFSDVVGLNAEQVRIAVGVVNFCPTDSWGLADCDNAAANNTPWFDNIRFGVYGDQDVPLIEAASLFHPQDAFPQDGTLHWDAPGRFDIGQVQGGEGIPAPSTSAGDTLVAFTRADHGLSYGQEVRVQFAVSPGPGIDGTDLSSWISGMAMENIRQGEQWYSARMDTAEFGGTNLGAHAWMGAFHELDPNFSGADTDTDPGDIDPLGHQSRLANDIFPDDLFTPGTRVNLFYKSRFVDLGSGLPVTGEWLVFPDTTGGRFLEWECLPSSMNADSSWNCVLFVDHGGSQTHMETALAAVLTGSSNNYEQTPWDRWDAQSASAGGVSFGRHINTEYGCRVTQLYGYKTVLWDTGQTQAFALRDEDAHALLPWLSLTTGGLGANRLYVSGDGAAASVRNESDYAPVALTLMNTWCGIDLMCNTVRDPSCNGFAGTEDSNCLPTDPVGGHFTGSTAGMASIGGNGCPELRDFDRLTVFPGTGTPSANESYVSPKNGGLGRESIDLKQRGRNQQLPHRVGRSFGDLTTRRGRLYR